MQTTYFNTVTSGTTPAPQLNTDGRAIVVRKILIGNPTSGGTVTLFNIGNALSNNTTQIAVNITYPSFSTTNINDGPDMYDFRAQNSGSGSTEEDGVPCSSGGSVAISGTMQVTVFWDYAEGN